MEELNRLLFLELNASGQSSPQLIGLATALAEYLIDATPLLLAALWLWGSRPERTAIVAATLSAALGLALNQLISVGYPHQRPFMVGLGHTLLAHVPDPSFPSDHATIFFALGLVFLRSSLRTIGVLLVLLGIAVGWARVYLGVHFPFDIVGALVVAAFSSWLARGVMTKARAAAWLMDWLEALYRRLFASPIARGWVRG